MPIYRDEDIMAGAAFEFWLSSTMDFSQVQSIFEREKSEWEKASIYRWSPTGSNFIDDSNGNHFSHRKFSHRLSISINEVSNSFSFMWCALHGKYSITWWWIIKESGTARNTQIHAFCKLWEEEWLYSTHSIPFDLTKLSCNCIGVFSFASFFQFFFVSRLFLHVSSSLRYMPR